LPFSTRLTVASLTPTLRATSASLLDMPTCYVSIRKNSTATCTARTACQGLVEAVPAARASHHGMGERVRAQP
jgi:hypothetical protein